MTERRTQADLNHAESRASAALEGDGDTVSAKYVRGSLSTTPPLFPF